MVAHSPLVEMGAGRGQWQRELTQRGADVLAFDNCTALPGGTHPSRQGASSTPPFRSVAAAAAAAVRGGASTGMSPVS